MEILTYNHHPDMKIEKNEQFSPMELDPKLNGVIHPKNGVAFCNKTKSENHSIINVPTKQVFDPKIVWNKFLG